MCCLVWAVDISRCPRHNSAGFRSSASPRNERLDLFFFARRKAARDCFPKPTSTPLLFSALDTGSCLPLFSFVLSFFEENVQIFSIPLTSCVLSSSPLFRYFIIQHFFTCVLFRGGVIKVFTSVAPREYCQSSSNNHRNHRKLASCCYSCRGEKRGLCVSLRTERRRNAASCLCLIKSPVWLPGDWIEITQASVHQHFSVSESSFDVDNLSPRREKSDSIGNN